jgi:hypothetical protein
MPRISDLALDSLEAEFAKELRRQLLIAIQTQDVLFFQSDLFDQLRLSAYKVRVKAIPELLAAALKIKHLQEKSGRIFDGCDASNYIACCRTYCDRDDHHQPGPLQLLERLRSNLDWRNG